MLRRFFVAAAFITTLIGITVWASEGKDKEATEHANARKALDKAKITMTQAIDAALGKLPKGKVVDAELELEGEGAEFEITIILDGKHQEIEINAVTGAVGEVKEACENEDKIKLGDEAVKCPISLKQALEIAQKSVPNGKAFEAKPEKEVDKIIWEIEFVDGDKVMEVEVDANTGKVLETEEEK